MHLSKTELALYIASSRSFLFQALPRCQNHLFLFHPEKYYLLHISGNGTYYDFPALEKIAQNIEVVETGLHVDSYENKVNFILADLAAG